MAATDVYAELMERLRFPKSECMFRILQKLVTPEEGKLLLELPAEPAELAHRTGLDEEIVRTKLQEFQEKGVAIKTKKGVQFARDVIQLHDATLSSAEKWVDSELLDLWKEFYEVEWLQTMASIPRDSYVKSVRVLPALKAIEQSPEVSADDLTPEENIRELIKGADLIAVVPCTCRRSLRRCDAPVDICLQFNRGAEYAIDRGAGRKLSAEEAIAIADEAEDVGLIHTWPFALSASLREICNCCRDCCILFDPGLRLGTIGQVLEKARFRAEVNRDLCTGCQDCVERCFFEAIDMTKSLPGKKLKATVDHEKCFGCGVCVVACEPGAITMNLSQT